MLVAFYKGQRCNMSLRVLPGVVPSVNIIAASESLSANTRGMFFFAAVRSLLPVRSIMWTVNGTQANSNNSTLFVAFTQTTMNGYTWVIEAVVTTASGEGRSTLVYQPPRLVQTS
jgi:hypothetical protein